MAATPDMWIFDGHLDLSLNYHRYKRDIRLPLDALRRADDDARSGRGTAMVSLPALREGGVGLAFATLLAIPCRDDRPPGECEYSTADESRQIALRDLGYYRRLQVLDHLRIVADQASLDLHVSQWEAGSRERRLGIVLLMEGADPIGSPAEVGEWYARGLRIIGPAWYGLNRYAHGTGAPDGLTAPGRGLLREMDRVGMILDVTHLAEQAFFESLDLFAGAVLASHSNVRAIVPGDRQLSDEMIRMLVQRDGVIGCAMDAWMLVPGWKKGRSNADVKLAMVADHIDRVCQLAGNARHAAIGSDLDGGFGREQCPSDLDSVADLPRLLDILAGRGYGWDDIHAIAHGNWLRLLRRAWKDR